MTLLEKELQLAKRFQVIEDAQERLAAVVDRGRKTPRLAQSQCVEANRVEGCISRVWLVAEREGERARFHLDAESAMVRGLASLICEVYDGTLLEEIAVHNSDILTRLELSAQLTPTRRHGMAQLHLAIRQFARRELSL